ncbi:MAG TPA: pitrilysin family protein [Armatimonadota bacterium]|jgi:predicted Zn-dependent peptidase
MKSAFLIALGILVVGPATAQDVPPPPTHVAAKNRAPVDKSILRVRFPRPKRYTLPNGLRLLVLEDHKLPTVDFSLSILAGSFFEPKAKTGLASMTASMLDEGTKTRSSQQIAVALDRMGASLSAGADQGAERAEVSASGLSTDTGAILGLMRDIVRNPVFPEAQFQKVKRQTVAGITGAMKDADTLAEIATRRALYGDTPPARVTPSITQVNALTRADLAAFHAAYYRPNRAILGVVGDVKADDIYKLALKALGDWKKGSGPLLASLPAFAPQTATKVFVVDRPGSVQTSIRLANLAITRKSPDFVPFTVMNRILGLSPTSRLNLNIRESKGYTYDVRSVFDAPRYLGAWVAQTEVRNAVTADTLTQFFNEFRRIETAPAPKAELDAAKRGIVGAFARRMESPDILLGMALTLEEYGLPADYWDRYPAMVQAVTPAAVQRVARQYIGEGRLQIVAVGEKSVVEEALKPYGIPETVDVVAGMK